MSGPPTGRNPRVEAITSPPVHARCANCPAQWLGKRSARQAAKHVKETGHTAHGWMPVTFTLLPAGTGIVADDGSARE